jgi:hypothetical protein
MASPLDLKAIAADRYRITLDESAKVDTSRDSKVWCTQIPAKHGHVGTYSERELSAFCSGRRLFARLLAIPTVRVVQEGDSEIRVAFSPQHLDQVATLLRARRRTVLSDSERVRRTALLQSRRES